MSLVEATATAETRAEPWTTRAKVLSLLPMTARAPTMTAIAAIAGASATLGRKKVSLAIDAATLFFGGSLGTAASRAGIGGNDGCETRISFVFNEKSSF